VRQSGLDTFPAIVKMKNVLWPRGMAGCGGEVEGTVEDTQVAAKVWWKKALNNAEDFITARVRQRPGLRGTNQTLPSCMQQRPRLREVLAKIREMEHILCPSRLGGE
jgi:hypothetical protein